MMLILRDELETAAAIITSVGIITGAIWLILRVFKTPARLQKLENELSDVKNKIRTMEMFQQTTKIYYAGFKDDLTEVKEKVSRIEDILLKYAK